jgi:hypothetical protein
VRKDNVADPKFALLRNRPRQAVRLLLRQEDLRQGSQEAKVRPLRQERRQEGRQEVLRVVTIDLALLDPRPVWLLRFNKQPQSFLDETGSTKRTKTKTKDGSVSTVEL